MIIEEYKETVLHELEKADDGNEVVEIINPSVERFPEGDLYKHLVVIYLHILQNGLEELPEQDDDFIKRRNIQYSLNYLKKMNENRGKPA